MSGGKNGAIVVRLSGEEVGAADIGSEVVVTVTNSNFAHLIARFEALRKSLGDAVDVTLLDM